MTSPSSNEKQELSRPRHRRSYSSATDSDDLSLWGDTGDLAEQLAGEEDPLRIELDPLNTEGQRLVQGHGGGRGKRVNFQSQNHTKEKAGRLGVDKDKIPIPNPAPRRIGKAEKILASIMAPSNEQARSRGLVGKPLLYVVPPL